MGIGEILKEARRYMREKRLAHDGFQELQEVYARRLAQEKEEAIRNAKEQADVVNSVRVHCEKRARVEVEDHEALDRKMYRMNIPKKKRRATRRRNRLWRYAVIIAAVGASEQIIVYSSKTSGAGEWLLAMAIVFYVCSLSLMVYAHYYIGPQAVGPWRPMDSRLLTEKIQLRTDDLLTKWDNQQKQMKHDMKELKRDKRAEREAAHKAEARAEAEKQRADKVRTDNARRRFASPSRLHQVQ